MRKLIVSTFLTLDGVMQAPGGPGEDESGGFALGGWSVNYWDEQMGQVMTEAMSAPFDLVLGRKTYDIFAAYWPHATDDEGAKPLNDATKYVASRSRPTLEWERSVLIEGDAAEGIAELKKEDGPELQVHGSGNLIQTLMRHSDPRLTSSIYTVLNSDDEREAVAIKQRTDVCAVPAAGGTPLFAIV